MYYGQIQDAMSTPENLSRRKFVQIAAVAGIGLPWANSLRANDSSANWQHSLIQSVKELINGQPASLTLLYPEGCLSNIKPVAQAFEKATGVRIQYQMTGVDTINSNVLLNAAQRKYAFDIAIPATFGIPDLVEAEALADLSAFKKKHEPKEHNAGALYSTGDYYQGKFYGYQTDGDAYLMFYNKAWLEGADEAKRFADAHGYPLAIPQTWEELDQMMAFFHRPEQNQYGGCLFRSADYLVWEWWIRLHAKGTFPLADDMTPLINGDKGIAALEELIRATQYQHPSAKTNGLFDNWKIYGQGNCFANIGWGGSQKYFRSKKSNLRDKLAFSTTPGGKKRDTYFKTPYFNWGWNYVVSRYSTNQELAYLFTLYATTPEMSSIAVSQTDGYFDPFRSEHYNDPTIIEAYGAPFLKAHQESMSQCIPDFYLNNYSDYFGTLKENLFLASNGDISPKVALNIVAKQWERITAKSGQENQAKQWQFLKSLYPENIKDCLR